MSALIVTVEIAPAASYFGPYVVPDNDRGPSQLRER